MASEHTKGIGERIEELLKERGMKQAELARRIPGKTQANDVWRWIDGRHQPSETAMVEIARVLGTTVADLHAGPRAALEDQKGETPDQPGTALNGNGRLSDVDIDRIADAVAERTAKRVAELLGINETAQTTKPATTRAAGEPSPPPPSDVQQPPPTGPAKQPKPQPQARRRPGKGRPSADTG